MVRFAFAIARFLQSRRHGSMFEWSSRRSLRRPKGFHVVDGINDGIFAAADLSCYL